MSLRRMQPGSIHVGSRLAWDVYDQNHNLLLRKGHFVDSATQIESLLSRGLFAEDAEGDEDEHVVEDKATPFERIDSSRGRLDHILANLRASQDFGDHIRHVAADIQEVCRRDSNAALACLLIDEPYRYSIRHQIHVAIVSEILGRRREISDERRLSMTCAALTMNLGMLGIQDQLQSYAQSLTEQQRATIRTHPEKCVQILKDAGIVDEVWLQTVLQHHEAYDGSGYPHGLKGEEISEEARIVALGDVLCAKLSGRKYRKPILPNLALRSIFTTQHTLDPALVSLLVKEIGVYPPGSFVRLVNGEIAIVRARGKSATTPLVMSVVGPKGSVYSVPVRRDSSRAMYDVKEMVSATTAGVRINRDVVWGYKVQ